MASAWFPGAHDRCGQSLPTACADIMFGNEGAGKFVFRPGSGKDTVEDVVTVLTFTGQIERDFGF